MPDSGPTTQTFTSADEIESTPLRLFSPGTQLANRYEIRQVIDWGGSAVVYAAYDRDLRRDIALKVLRHDRVTDAALTRFRREVAVARDASSPRLVRIFDIVTSDGAIYLTMELVDGGSLRKRLADTPQLPIDEVIRLASAIAEALDALHTLGIVHRDVKPGNVLLETPVGSSSATSASRGMSNPRACTRRPQGQSWAPSRSVSRAGAGRRHRSPLRSLRPRRGHLRNAGRDVAIRGSIGARHSARAHEERTHRRPASPPRLSSLAGAPGETVARAPAGRSIPVSAGSGGGPAAPQDGSHSETRLALDASRRRTGHRHGSVGHRGARVASPQHLLSCHRFGRWHAPGRERFRKRALEPGRAINRRPVSPRPAGEGAWGTAGDRGHSPPARRAPHAPNHTLSFLDPQTGAVRRTVVLPNASDAFRYLPARYSIGSMFAFDLNDDGYQEILATFIQIPEWPSYTVLYEPRIGRARIVFIATGHHHPAGFADLDGDGHKDLLFHGIHNGYGWYNAAAAVSIQPPVDDDVNTTPEAAFTPDIVTAGEQDQSPLLWYTYLPRGQQPQGIRAFADGATIRIDYPGGRRLVLGKDGLPIELDDRVRRADARMEAFAALRDADRLSGAGSMESAATRLNESLALAKITGNPLLIEAVEIRRGRSWCVPVTSRKPRSITSGSRTAKAHRKLHWRRPRSCHLAGEVEKALQWYRRGLAYGSRGGRGRSRHEFIEGFVLAAVELGRWRQGIDETIRFQATYGQAVQEWTTYYREFVRWRSGGTPDVSTVQLPSSAIDVMRYWELEFAYTNGVAPASLLPKVAADLEERSPARSALLSLHAELLYKTGRTGEARAVILRAVRALETDRAMTTIARAHAPLVIERYQKIMGSP